MSLNEAAANSVASDTLKILMSTLNPRGAQTMPPNLHHDTTFSKKIDFSGSFKIGDDTALNEEKVPSQSGCILWLPQRGAVSMYRMGFVQDGTSIAIVAKSGLIVQLDTLGSVMCPSFLLNSTMKFTNPVAIPYLDHASSGNGITYAPALERNFSTCRLFSGLVRVYVDSTSVGLTALSGTLSAGSLGDTRDVCRNLDVYPPTCYSAMDLNQSSMTKQDGLKNVRAQDGIVSLIGPDISPFFTVPNRDNYDSLFGESQTVTLDKFRLAPASLTGTGVSFGLQNQFTNSQLNFGNQLMVSTAWASPWGIEWDVGTDALDPMLSASGLITGTGINANMASFHQNIKDIPPIDECGTLDFAVNAKFNFFQSFDRWLTSPTPESSYPNNTWQAEVNFVHFFATVREDGSLEYNTFNEKETCIIQDGWSRGNASGVTVASTGASFGSNIGTAINWPHFPPNINVTQLTAACGVGTSIFTLTAKSSAARFRGTYDKVGKYMGTMITIGARLLMANPRAPVATALQLQGSTVVGLSEAPSVTITARTISDRGNTGPARIIRWDGVSPNVNMKVDAIANAQCIPQGDLAPFVQEAAMYASAGTNVNVLPWLAAVYNGNTPIHRNWIGLEYDSYIRNLREEVTMDTISGWARNDSKVLSASNASGLFSSIGGALGSLAGPLGGILGHAVGSVGDHLLGASGSFHSRRRGRDDEHDPHGQIGAMGQFGSGGHCGAMGEFGAMGQFGAMSQFGA